MAEKLEHCVASIVPARPVQLLMQMLAASQWPLWLWAHPWALHATGIDGFGCCQYAAFWASSGFGRNDAQHVCSEPKAHGPETLTSVRQQQLSALLAHSVTWHSNFVISKTPHFLFCQCCLLSKYARASVYLFSRFCSIFI